MYVAKARGATFSLVWIRSLVLCEKKETSPAPRKGKGSSQPHADSKPPCHKLYIADAIDSLLFFTEPSGNLSSFTEGDLRSFIQQTLESCKFLTCNMVAKPLQGKINQLVGRSPVLCAVWWCARPAKEKDPGEVEHLGIPATASSSFMLWIFTHFICFCQ